MKPTQKLNPIRDCDIATGKKLQSVTVADVDFFELLGGVSGRPPRAFIVPDGAPVTVVNMDDTTETLPDTGGAFVWPSQIKGLRAAGSTATTVVLVW